MAQKPTEEQLNKFIQKEVGEWAAFVTDMLRDELKKKKVVLTKGLLNSIRQQAAGQINQRSVMIYFREYGRFADMRRNYYTKQPPVEIIEQWIKEVGVEKFKFIPGYYKNKVPTVDEQAKRIAWGVARSRKENNFKKRQTRWFNKKFYGSLNDLMERIMFNYQDFAAKYIKENIEG